VKKLINKIVRYTLVETWDSKTVCIKRITWWLFRRCTECGTKLPKRYKRGLCKRCWNDFNGMTIEEIING